jgi:hypothetical protein
MRVLLTAMCCLFLLGYNYVMVEGRGLKLKLVRKELLPDAFQ